MPNFFLVLIAIFLIGCSQKVTPNPCEGKETFLLGIVEAINQSPGKYVEACVEETRGEMVKLNWLPKGNWRLSEWRRQDTLDVSNFDGHPIDLPSNDLKVDEQIQSDTSTINWDNTEIDMATLGTNWDEDFKPIIGARKGANWIEVTTDGINWIEI